jgi:hypothetical protein
MFVPVTCTNCGKPFQVPETALGKLAPCPWCEAVVTALPASAPQPQAEPQQQQQQPAPAKPQAAEAPLSLDDEPPPKRKPTAPAGAQSVAPSAASLARSRSWRWPLDFKLLLLVALMIAVGAVTVGVLRWKRGYVLDTEWKTFTPTDGSCSVDLLGRPVEDSAEPGAGGRRYTSEGWYSGTKAWIGWRELRPNEASLANELDAAEKAIKEWEKLHPNEVGRMDAPKEPQGRPLLRSSIFNPEIERLKSAFGGYIVKDATIQFENPITVEVRLETPHGLLVERIIVKADGPHPRVYFIGMVGKRLAADGPELERLFSSFRVND